MNDGPPTKDAPARGTILYRVSWDSWPNCEIEEYVFLEESIVEGASLPTWIIRERNKYQKLRVSKTHNSYYFTKAEAVRVRIEELKKAVVDARQGIDAAKHRLVETKRALASARLWLAEAASPNRKRDRKE